LSCWRSAHSRVAPSVSERLATIRYPTGNAARTIAGPLTSPEQ
jgi:hypothetical protein